MRPLVDVGQARRAGITQFAGLVLYEPVAGGGPFDVYAVWTGPNDLVEIGAPAQVSTTSPQIGVDLADLAALGIDPAVGDVVTRAGIRYRVDDVQPDGEGGADLILHRVD